MSAKDILSVNITVNKETTTTVKEHSVKGSTRLSPLIVSPPSAPAGVSITSPNRVEKKSDHPCRQGGRQTTVPSEVLGTGKNPGEIYASKDTLSDSE